MKWLRAWLERRERLAERSAAALEKIAEQAANRGPKVDSDARAAIGALLAREKALVERLAAVEARTKEPQALLVEQLHAEVVQLRKEQRSLRGKLYKDPEFHTPSKREEDDGAPLQFTGIIGGDIVGGLPP